MIDRDKFPVRDGSLIEYETAREGKVIGVVIDRGEEEEKDDYRFCIFWADKGQCGTVPNHLFTHKVEAGTLKVIVR